MDTVSTAGPGLSHDPASPSCPHDAGGGGGYADPAALNAAALAKLTEIGVEMMDIVRHSARAAEQVSAEQVQALDVLARMVRRGIALNARLFADSRKTPEQLAAEAARRDAIAEARLHARTQQVQSDVTKRIEQEAPPGDREYLLRDLAERLEQPEMQMTLTRLGVHDAVQRLCHDMGITPKQESWSDALMAQQAKAKRAEMAQAAADRAAWEARVAAGMDWRAEIEFSPPPGEVRKIGRFTFGPTGEMIAEEPMETDRPQSEWARDVLERELPDFSRKKKPPDSG